MYSSGKNAGLARDQATSVRATALTTTRTVIGAMATRTATVRIVTRGWEATALTEVLSAGGAEFLSPVLSRAESLD
jgi:hypothetical protein